MPTTRPVTTTSWWTRFFSKLQPGRPPAEEKPELAEREPDLTQKEEEEMDTFLTKFLPEARATPFSEDELEQLSRLSPKCRELWSRCDRLSDQEAIELFETIDPVKNPEWMTAVSQNLSRRFMLDHRNISRSHSRIRRPRN